MKNFFARLQSQLVMGLGIDRLENRFLKFCLTHFFFIIFTNIHGAFISTLILRVTGDSHVVMMYNVANYLSGAFFMTVAVAFLRKTSPKRSLQLGILFFIMMYAVYLLTMDYLQYFVLLMGFLNGLASGFYWISYSLSMTGYCSDDTRDTALGLLNLGTGVISLTVPFLSSIVISRFAGTGGYRVMFSLAMVIAVFTIWLSTRMDPIVAPSGKTDYRSALRMCLKDRLYRNLCLCEALKGIREGTLGFFLNILLFQIITNEMIVGVNSLLGSLSSILASALYGKLVRANTRLKSVWISFCVLMVAAMMLFLKLNTATLLIFSIINSLFGTYLVSPVYTTFIAGICVSDDSKALQSEILAVREWSLNIGRIGGVIITLLMPQTSFGSVLAIVILTLFQLLMYYLLKVSSEQIEERAVKA